MKNNKSFLNITIETDEESNMAVINIDGMIGEDPWEAGDEQNTTSNMRNKLKEIAALNVEEIEVNINSLGGSVSDGLAIHDLLKESPAFVTTKINGMSASSATIIFQAGDKREISTNAMMLVHRAWTMGMGNTEDFEALSDDLKKTDNVIANIYAKRSGKDVESFLELMSENGGDGKWLDAEEALEFGLVDEAVEPKFKKVAMDKSAFENLGLPLPTETEDVEVVEEEISNETDEDETKNVTVISPDDTDSEDEFMTSCIAGLRYMNVEDSDEERSQLCFAAWQEAKEEEDVEDVVEEEVENEETEEISNKGIALQRELELIELENRI